MDTMSDTTNDAFIDLYREVANLNPPEGSGLDAVLEQFQTRYDAVAPPPHEAKEITERDKAYHSIFVTALEGGIGYWSVCKSYRWSLGAPNYDEDYLGFEAIVTEEESDEPDLHQINRAVIAKGVAKFTDWAKDHGNNYFRQASDHLARGRWDHLDVDADIADAIVQLGLFGELVYG